MDEICELLAIADLEGWYENMFTFGAGFNGTVFDNVEAIAQLSHDAAILFVNQHDAPRNVRAMAALGITFTGLKIGGVIGGRFISASFPCLCSGSIRWFALCRSVGRSAGLFRRGSWCSLEECGALRKDRLKGVDVLLHTRPASDDGEL